MTKTLTKNKEVAGTTPEEITQTNDSSAPIWKRQLNRVQSAMWKHGQNGKTRYTVSISRSYKDGKGKWQSVHYFDRQDLDDVIAIAKEAEEEILREKGMVVDVGED